MEKQRHHIVQKKYLNQWKISDAINQLNIYVIPENKYIQRGPDWKGFWRINYNILKDEKEQFYLPEKITGKIDTEGLKVIKKIKPENGINLNGYDRSSLSFYIALQYIRTPKFREEEDKFMGESIKMFMKNNMDSPEKYKIKKEDILKEKPRNEKDRKALEKIKSMSEKEINQESFDFLHSDDCKIIMNNTGHSKQILKTEKRAKELFKFEWLFLTPQKETSFITSDNPCFTISSTKFRQGLLSPNVIIFFPLRPDLCITIKPKIKSFTENILKLNKKEVRDINNLIVKNSYQCVIAKDKKQLTHLTKKYDYKNHKRSKDVAIYKKGDYVIFNLE